jgi:hypothetical protein
MMMLGPYKSESTARLWIGHIWKEKLAEKPGADTWVVGSEAQERSVGDE